MTTTFDVTCAILSMPMDAIYFAEWLIGQTKERGWSQGEIARKPQER